MATKLVCGKDGCQEDMTTMKWDDIVQHDVAVHNDYFLVGT